jgi:hypothetical protein
VTGSKNLLRAFERNAAAIRELIGSGELFDINRLNALVLAREALIGEVPGAGLTKEELEGLVASHRLLERVIAAARSGAESLLGRLGEGRRALAAYRK